MHNKYRQLRIVVQRAVLKADLSCYKEDTRVGHIQRERLPKSKMASSDDRFTFEIVHVLRFGNELNKELCCSFIFTNLQQSLDL